MRNDPILINSLIPAFPNPAAWMSFPLDLGAFGSNQASFHIVWQDVALTFYLWCANGQFLNPTSPPWHDSTAEYRALDPGWVDPVVGDPLSEHVVRFINIGARYVRLGFTGGDWTGVVNPFLQILFWRQRSNR